MRKCGRKRANTRLRRENLLLNGGAGRVQRRTGTGPGRLKAKSPARLEPDQGFARIPRASLANNNEVWILTKHRLMLSAATAALLAAPLTISAAHAAATTITETRKAAIDTTTLGDITITSGGVDIKAATPAVTINSNNFLINQGSISNQNTAGAIGIAVDTTAGDIVNST